MSVEEMSNVTPITQITRMSLMTLQKAEEHAIELAIKYLRQTQPDPPLCDLAKLLGISRHATKRRLKKYGFELKLKLNV